MYKSRGFKMKTILPWAKPGSLSWTETTGYSRSTSNIRIVMCISKSRTGASFSLSSSAKRKSTLSYQVIHLVYIRSKRKLLWATTQPF